MSTVQIPRVVIAAPSSGSGKTTVATGLMAAYTAGGLTVSPHKVGPDYIDPGYHGLATGRPGRNLDAYLCGTERIAPLFAHGAAGAQLAVIEGVMGLFDGAGGAAELASTAQVAKLLRAPVVLVVDASSQSRSVAALVHGFASWDPQVRIAGVVLNKVGSDRHEELLREALSTGVPGVPVLGVLRRVAEVGTPSRHLGLVPVAERRAAALESVAALGASVRAGCDLDALLALARSAPPLPVTPWDPAREVAAPAAVGVRLSCAAAGRRWVVPPLPHSPSGMGGAPIAPRNDGPQPTGVRGGAPVSGRGGNGERLVPVAPAPAGQVRVAVAGGRAFTFSYAEHAELLRAAGAEPVPFDPLHDEALPARTRGLVVGGGFPEVYGPELSANEPLRAAVSCFAASGAPVAAECAGLLYLSRELDGRPMCGVLDATARMTGKLTLGYRDAVAAGDSALAPAGFRVRGHEFHRTVLAPGAGSAPAWGLVRPERRTEGYVAGVRGNVHASYLHVHWAAAPELARRFVERCAG